MASCIYYFSWAHGGLRKQTGRIPPNDLTPISEWCFGWWLSGQAQPPPSTWGAGQLETEDGVTGPHTCPHLQSSSRSVHVLEARFRERKNLEIDTVSLGWELARGHVSCIPLAKASPKIIPDLVGKVKGVTSSWEEPQNWTTRGVVGSQNWSPKSTSAPWNLWSLPCMAQHISKWRILKVGAFPGLSTWALDTLISIHRKQTQIASDRDPQKKVMRRWRQSPGWCDLKPRNACRSGSQSKQEPRVCREPLWGVWPWVWPCRHLD